MTSKPRTLLTFDAFGTLFTPRASIAKQYGDVARKHGMTGFNNGDVGNSFRNAFKQESIKRPNYGKEVGMKATEWWSNVITSTFRPFSDLLPDDLVPELLTRFSSSEGYVLYPDVLPFFQALRRRRQRSSNSSEVLLGILTNSDDRVPSILTSLGLRVGLWRYGTEEGRLHATSETYHDIDFVALSYDIGFEKPHCGIFDAAREMASTSEGHITRCIHVGDDLEKDYRGAEGAGWTGLLLDRDNMYALDSANRIRSLAEVQRYIDC